MLPPTESNAFETRGYVLRPGLLKPELVQRMLQAIKPLEQLPDEELPAGCLRSRTPVLREIRLINIVEQNDVFLEPLVQPELLELADALVPAPYRVIEACCHSRLKGIGLPLHSVAEADFRITRRGPKTHMLKVAIALTDIGLEDGPTVVFEGSHRLGDDFSYALIDQDWETTGNDLEMERAFRDQQAGRNIVPWAEIPGHRTVSMKAGDAIVFTDDLWHGAMAVANSKIRRMMCFTYSPYHFANMHGIQYSDALLERSTPRQRMLLAGPFHGTRYAAVDSTRIPEALGFVRLLESDVKADFLEPDAGPE
jgi:hypothetical protein